MKYIDCGTKVKYIYVTVKFSKRIHLLLQSSITFESLDVQWNWIFTYHDKEQCKSLMMYMTCYKNWVTYIYVYYTYILYCIHIKLFLLYVNSLVKIKKIYLHIAVVVD